MWLKFVVFRKLSAISIPCAPNLFDLNEPNTILFPPQNTSKKCTQSKLGWLIYSRKKWVCHVIGSLWFFAQATQIRAGRFQRARKTRLSLPLPPILICVICDGCQNFVPPNFSAQQLCLNWFYVVIRGVLNGLHSFWATHVFEEEYFSHLSAFLTLCQKLRITYFLSDLFIKTQIMHGMSYEVRNTVRWLCCLGFKLGLRMFTRLNGRIQI